MKRERQRGGERIRRKVDIELLREGTHGIGTEYHIQ